MNKDQRRRVDFVQVMLLLMLLVGCGSSTPAPTATIVAAPLPADWQRIDLPRLSLALPPEWVTTSADDLDVGDAVAEMSTRNPQLKSLLEQGRVALNSGQVQLIAYDVAAERADPSGFPANLRIGQQTFAQAPTLAAVSDVNEQELRATAGFSDVTRDTILLGGVTVTRLRSTLQITDSAGEPLKLALEQYLLLHDKNMAVVTLTTAAGQQPTYRPIFDQILATLQLKQQP